MQVHISNKTDTSIGPVCVLQLDLLLSQLTSIFPSQMLVLWTLSSCVRSDEKTMSSTETTKLDSKTTEGVIHAHACDSTSLLKP